MKTPKGFGKNYFSLSAICAYSCGVSLQAQCSSFTHISRNLSFETLEEEDEPLLELEALLLKSTPTPKSSTRHCNCFFKNLFCTLTQLFKLFPQTFVIFFKTHSGIAPPLKLLNINNNFKIRK